jgi:hypothetical protein
MADTERIAQLTQHEFLRFMNGLHEFLEQKAGSGAFWPTRELLHANVYKNRQVWGPGWSGQFRQTLAAALRKGYVVAGQGEGCSVHCHAVHVRMTELGYRTLGWMNEGGCYSHAGVISVEWSMERERCHSGFSFSAKSSKALA